MPRVPSAFPAVQAESNLMSLRVDDTSREVGAVAGQRARQIEQNGQSIKGVGLAMLEEATRMQIEANRVQVVAAQNRAMQAKQALTYGEGDKLPGYLSFRGESAVVRPDKIPLTDDYAQKLRSVMSDLQENLGNDTQKNAFAAWRSQFETDFIGEVQRHVMGEFRSHQQSTFKGALELAVSDAQKNWANPDKVKNAIDGLQVPGDPNTRYGGVAESAYQLAKAQGKSALETEYMVKQAKSQAHLGVITSALANKQPAYADSYMKSHKDDMLENDILRVSGDLQRHVDANLANTAVRAAAKDFAERFQPTDWNRLETIVRGLESGSIGDFGKDGQPLTSPKGAKYAMQVMPATAKNPGYGIQPAKDDSPAEYNRVGREYLAVFIKKYGNIGQALGAYNAGPGRMDDAIMRSKTDNVPESWASYLPDETQQYVRRGVDQFMQGGGKPAPPTELEYVESVVNKLGPNASAEAVKLARDGASNQYRLIERSIKDKRDAAKAEGMKWLDQNGGRYSEMPDNLRAAIDPEDRDNLRNYGQRVAKGDDITDRALYQKLATDPKFLKGLSDNEFYLIGTRLSESDRNHFASERGKLLDPTKSTNTAEDLNTAAINDVLNNRLRSWGRDPSPKEESSEAQVVGAMRKTVRESILNAQRATGKKMTDAEVEKHIDGMFAKVVTFTDTFLGMDTGQSSMRMMAMQPGDIPDDTRKKLKADFKKRGIEPTDGDLLGAYWGLKNAAQNGKDNGASGKW